MPGSHKENKVPRAPNLNVVSARTTALFDVEIFSHPTGAKTSNNIEIWGKGRSLNHDLLTEERHFTFAYQARYPQTWCPLLQSIHAYKQTNEQTNNMYQQSTDNKQQTSKNKHTTTTNKQTNKQASKQTRNKMQRAAHQATQADVRKRKRSKAKYLPHTKTARHEPARWRTSNTIHLPQATRRLNTKCHSHPLRSQNSCLDTTRGLGPYETFKKHFPLTQISRFQPPIT